MKLLNKPDDMLNLKKYDLISSKLEIPKVLPKICINQDLQALLEDIKNIFLPTIKGELVQLENIFPMIQNQLLGICKDFLNSSANTLQLRSEEKVYNFLMKECTVQILDHGFIIIHGNDYLRISI